MPDDEGNDVESETGAAELYLFWASNYEAIKGNKKKTGHNNIIAGGFITLPILLLLALGKRLQGNRRQYQNPTKHKAIKEGW